MNNPLVSIVVCTHNRADKLKHTMETILAQKYKPVEIVVLDDGSTDDTEELIKSYGDEIRYYKQENKGIAAARTAGCQMARGEYIAFQDDDDLMPPERIIYLYDALCQHPQAVFAVGDWIVIDHEGNSTGKRSRVNFKVKKEEALLVEDGYKAVLWPLLSPLPHTTLFRKADGEHIGWFDDARFFHACSDTDFFARLGQLGPIVYVPKIVSYYRMGHNQIWNNEVLTEYSRFLLFEKHLKSLNDEHKDLKKRLKIRLLGILKRIAFLKRYGIKLPDSVPGNYLKRGLSLIGIKNRLLYSYYTLIRLPIRRLIFPKIDLATSPSCPHRTTGEEY